VDGRNRRAEPLVASPRMTDGDRPRLFIVTAAPQSVGDRVIEVLSSLGVALPPALARVALNELAVATGIGDGGCTTTCEMASSSSGRDPLPKHSGQGPTPSVAEIAGVAAWPFPSLDTTLAALLDGIAESDVAVSTIVSWDEPSTVSSASARSMRGVALARWEQTMLGVLQALRDRSCLVLPPGHGPEVRSALADHLSLEFPTTPQTDGDSDARAGSPAGDGLERPTDHSGDAHHHGEILWSQRRLAQTLRDLVGPHPSLARVDLPAPSAWTVALWDAERRARVAAADAADAWRQVHKGARPLPCRTPLNSWQGALRTPWRTLRRRWTTRRGVER
jgi:hypothetical protein